MPISVSVKRKIDVAHSCEEVYRLLCDVVQSGECMSSVEKVISHGDEKFEFVLKEQGLDGVKSMSFKGNYIAQYRFEPNYISWQSVSGNMASRGSYRFEPTPEGVSIFAELHNDLPLTVPPIFKVPVEMLVRHALLKTVVDMLNNLTAAEH